jgi:thermitase
LPAIFASGTYAPGELVVRFKASTRETRIDECLRGIDARIRTEIEELNTLVLRSSPGKIASIYKHVLDCAGVLYVEPNFLLQAADTIPNDPHWGLQYGLVNIRAPQGWDLTTGSAAVTIAIIDTGVDFGHPDLAGKLVAGYDFVNNDADPQDDNGHGTHVAGIAAASSNNGTGIAGVSWGARIMPVKVLNSAAGGTYANTAAGIVWAVDHGAQVINLSLGATDPSSVLEDAISYAHSQGVVIVAAAGNGNNNFVLYPARYPNVIAVARTNSANNWDDSNYGPEIDLAAPGALIYSTVVGGYEYKSGSSMSTGFVSGLAAILMGISGNASPDAIEFQMESTALDIEFTGWDEYTGAGLIQMDAAIQLALLNTNQPDEPGASATGGGSGFIQVAPSNTPLPTWTASPAFPSSITTATFTSEPGSTEIQVEPPVDTPIQEAYEVGAQADTGSISAYILPCAGTGLILSGLALAWLVRKKQKSLRRL